jgi:superfamily II DNA/RNA helicase
VNFEYLGLAPETLRAVEEAGYKEPTPIQAQAIPVVLQGRDVLGIAQTGTGKTASFTLPMIDILSQGRARARMPRSLILEPTRELAAQVAQNFEIYGKYHKLNMALLIGGVSFDDQERKLDRGVDVLIATPGRLLDHFGRGKLMMTGVDILVIDEADRMLDMGFIPDVERICSLITKKHQTLFFSATMPREIQNLVSKFLTDPKRIEVAPPSSTASTVEQFLVPLHTGEAGAKRAKLRELLRGEEIKNAIIFCNRKRDVDVVYRSLKKHGFNAAALHGDMDQSSRMEVLDTFKAGGIQLLIASDVAARGLDIPAMSHVFNYDVPSHAEDYIHRIGRTGRAGRSGRTFMISTPADSKWLRNVQTLIGKPISILDGDSAAPNADEGDTVRIEASEERRGRRRRRGRGGQDRNGSAQQQPASPQPVQQQATQQQATQQQADDMNEPRRTRDNDQRRGSGRDRNDGRRDDRRDRDRGRNRSRDRYRDDDFEPVVGLGDHVPEFLLRTFKIAPIAADDDEDEIELEVVTDAEIPAEAAVEAPAEQAADAASTEEGAKAKRKRRPRGRKPRDTADQAAGEETASEDAPGDAVADAVPEDTAEAAPAVEAPAEPAVADAPAAKPKRTRKPRAKAAEAPVAEDAAPAAEAAPEQPEAAQPEAAPAKPKRTRKPKAKAADEAPAADTSAEPSEEKAKPARKPRAPRKSAAKAA